MKNKLNEKFWEKDGKLNTQVRKNLLQIAKDFIAFTKVKNLTIDDIILTGSMANYNWNEKSDVDIHINFNLQNFERHKRFIMEYLQSKKAIWNANHDVSMFDHIIEIYPDDKDSEHQSTGIFSLIKNDWIKKPEKPSEKDVKVDKKQVMKKYQDKVDAVLYIEEQAQKKGADAKKIIKDIEKFVVRIRDERKEGLKSDGEFAVENLVFKMLRNNGYIEKLKDLKHEIYDKSLSLKEQPKTE